MDASLSNLAARAAPAPAEDEDHPSFRSALNEPSVELRFEDFLDVINPLQHIPIVGSIYRALTGDEISGSARVIGGALFGGPIGFVGGIVNAIAAEIAGDGLGELALAALVGKDDARGAAEAPPLALAALQDAPVPLAVVNHAYTESPALTGAAALHALTADLRATPAAPAVSSMAPATLDEFTLKLLDGLDKYKAIAVTHQRLDETL